MIRIECPKCGKDSYSLSVENFRPCPYCGIIFSGKFGLDRRNEFRTKNEKPFIFFHSGKKIKANTNNLSSKGIGIKMLDNPYLTIGDILNINVGKNKLKAKLIWLNGKNGNYAVTAGLKVLKKI